MNSTMIDMLFSFPRQLIIVVIFSGLFLLECISKKCENKIFDIIATVIIFTISTFIIFYKNTGSTFTSYFALAFVMISVIYILNFVKLTIVDYSVLFSVIILSDIYRSSYFDRTFFVSILFFSILCVYKIRMKTLKGNIFNMWFTFILVVIVGYFFEFIFDYFIRVKIGYSLESTMAKLIVWGISAIIAVIINLVIIYILKKTFNKYFYEVNEMGRKYPTIENYFIYTSIGILFVIMLIYFGYYQVNGYNHQVTQLLNIFCMFALLIQLLYLTLLFRVTYLKDNLSSKELENQSLALYSSNLEKNIDDIKGIKHDIKNIFYTMSQYVEESDNQEMRLFYQTKIHPFAADEIKKNDLYGKLMTINNEQLKAFLYYKISQALERNINTEIEIDLSRELFVIAIDFTDLIRILGILIDNAIEECVGIPDSNVSIKISQNNELASYIIKNTVDCSKKEKGIKIGVSSKGEDRGNGLAIVQNTIEKYDFVMLNSYFKEDLFVQSLNVYLEN